MIPVKGREVFLIIKDDGYLIMEEIVLVREQVYNACQAKKKKKKCKTVPSMFINIKKCTEKEQMTHT